MGSKVLRLFMFDWVVITSGRPGVVCAITSPLWRAPLCLRLSPLRSGCRSPNSEERQRRLKPWRLISISRCTIVAIAPLEVGYDNRSEAEIAAGKAAPSSVVDVTTVVTLTTHSHFLPSWLSGVRLSPPILHPELRSPTGSRRTAHYRVPIWSRWPLSMRRIPTGS